MIGRSSVLSVTATTTTSRASGHAPEQQEQRHLCSSDRPTYRKSDAMSSRPMSRPSEALVLRFEASSSMPGKDAFFCCFCVVTTSSIARQPSSENFFAISSLMYSPRLP